MSDDALATELGEISDQLQALARRASVLGEQVSGSPVTHNTEISPGRRLARARARANMTQSGLAEVSGVAVNTIINFEKGHTTPRTRTLMKLAEAIGIPWEMLHEGDDDG